MSSITVGYFLTERVVREELTQGREAYMGYRSMLIPQDHPLYATILSYANFDDSATPTMEIPTRLEKVISSVDELCEIIQREANKVLTGLEESNNRGFWRSIFGSKPLPKDPYEQVRWYFNPRSKPSCY